MDEITHNENAAILTDTPEVPVPEKKMNPRIPFIMVFALPVLVYFQTISFRFTHFDDTQIISNNMSFLEDLSNLPGAFSTGAFILENSSFYRPMQTVSYMIDIALSGGNKPWMYHLTNVLLLGLISLVFLQLLKRFSVPPKLAMYAVLIFSLHPLFISSVAWIPARGDLLLSLFGMLSFRLLIDFLESRNRKYLFLHGLTLVLALFCKETAVFLPPMFILYYFAYRYEGKIDKPLFILTGFYVVAGVFWFWMRNRTIGEISYQNGIFGVEAVMKNLRNIPEGVAKFFLPFNIAPIPGYSLFNTAAGVVLIGLLGLLFFAGKGTGTKKEKLFWLTWFLFLLLPTMVFKHLRIDYLDHRFFLPLIGLVIFVLLSLPKHWMKDGDISKTWIPMLIILGLGIYTFVRSKDYSDPMNYYDAAIAHNESSAFSFNNRGFLKMRAGDNSGALADYDRAIELSPTYYKAYSDRGWVKSGIGNTEGALADLDVAISLNSQHTLSFYRRGVTYLNSGNIPNAIRDFDRLLELDPNNAQGYNYRGLAKIRGQRYAEAIPDLDKAIALDPQFAEAYGYRAIAKYSTYDTEGALQDAETTLRLNPKDEKMRRIYMQLQQEVQGSAK